MPLRPARAARRGVIGRPVARTAAVAGTAAVAVHGVNRRHDRRRRSTATDAEHFQGYRDEDLPGQSARVRFPHERDRGFRVSVTLAGRGA